VFPVVEGSLLVITFLSKILGQVVFLVDFFSLRTPNENRLLRLMKPHLWGILSIHYPENLQLVLLFETLSVYRFEQVIPLLFAGIEFMLNFE
jgi:hypothetical protein